MGGRRASSMRHSRFAIRHGFTLIEVVISMLIVGGMFAASLSALTAARAGQVHIAQRSAAMPLARAKMAEVMVAPFADVAGQPDEALVGTDNWTRRVVVAWVSPADLTTPAASDTGLKRITVTVRRGEAALVDLVALRAQAHPDLESNTVMP